MTDDGNLILTGIKPAVKHNFNFTPTPQVWLLRFNKESQVFASNTNHWLWGGLTIAALVVIIIGITLRRNRKHVSSTEPQQPLSTQSVIDEKLMQRIYQLMENEKPYLNSELKVSDLAEKLGTTSRNISDCIRKSTNNSFANYINAYRIDYAKALMRQQPDKKIS